MNDTIRLFRWEDMPAVITVMNQYAEATSSQNRVTLEEMEPRWRAPHNHPDQTCFVLERPDGTLGGFTIADLLDDPAEANGVYFVLPGDQTAAEQLVQAAEDLFRQRAETAGVSTATMTYSLSEKATDGINALEARGYAYVRQFHTMYASLESTVVEDEPPEGITLRPIDPTRDAKAAYDAQNEAFLDHWNSSHLPFEEWMYEMQKPEFDPQHWWIAVDGEEIAGMILSDGRNAQYAWIDILGVRPAWRKRGLGLLLLQRCFAAHQQKGRTRIGLGVDVDNRYRATALYERAGMKVSSRTLYYQKKFQLNRNNALLSVFA